MEPARTSHRFSALDGWRGVCALMVVLFHLNAATHIHALTRNGWVAVDFFFVLSGFVLMSGFDGRVTTGQAFRRFALRRLMRLYPLHLVALAVLVALIAVDAWRSDEPLLAGAHGLPALLQCLALVQGFTTQALSWNFPSWSVSIELWASLLFGLALWLGRTRAWMVFAVVVVVLLTVVLTFGEPEGPATTESGALLKAGHYLMAFAVGAVLFPIFSRVSRSGWAPPAWVEWPALAVVVALFGFAAQLNSPETIGLFVMAIFIFAFETGPVSRALITKPLQAVGRWSYSIYLIHPLWTIATYTWVGAAGRRLNLPAVTSDASLILGGPFAMDVVAALCLAAVIATAALTFRFIETPGIRLAKRAP